MQGVLQHYITGCAVLFSIRGLKLVASCVLLVAAFAMLATLLVQPANAARIKDIVAVEGVRDNILVGYGLVVGLDGTGDRLNNTPFTNNSLRAVLERLGVSIGDANLNARNVAAVTVTATLPAFSRAGSRIDVTVSTMGDAGSLEGGTLIATPLMGADNNLYAVAQGAVSIGGFESSGSGTSISQGVPTNGYVPNGAIVEREIEFALNDLDGIHLALRNPDITTARQIALAINEELTLGAARAMDPGTVRLDVPERYRGDVASLLSDIERLEVTTDQVARILIDEASGTIVMNENVTIDTVAVAQGNLVVQVSAPVELGLGVTTPPTNNVTDEGAGQQIALVENAATLQELVDGLNALGVGPRDMITILRNIKAAGALQAEIITR